jgi:hypothetical protein
MTSVRQDCTSDGRMVVHKGSESKRSWPNPDGLLSSRFVEGRVNVMKNVGIGGVSVVIRTGHLQGIVLDRYHHTTLRAVQVLKINHRYSEFVF